ncbi:ZIP family metal transporter [Clostridium polynesiense]|uniref:ZIP family metal transporter n=1 Tax=Clostridium polynesiense TaxID=1325933 RepID=UPI00058B2792|nr:ZIP family metal transporter [Clostridium polynesiense]
MFKYIYIIILSMSISLAGTMLGASIGVIIKRPSKRLLGIIMGFAAGLMLAVVVFELIPEAVNMIGVPFTIILYFLGIIIILGIEKAVNKRMMRANNYIKVAFITAIGLMLHNLPEGIIMGCGFLVDKNLGLGMSAIIAIHDIPEGIAVTAPLMASKVKNEKILTYAFLTALPTALGAAIGVMAGRVSDLSLGICLALASGIMMYVVFCELIPESNRLWEGVVNSISVIIGLTIGFIMINLI